MQKGAACNLVYLGCINVESLSGDGAVHYAVNKITSQGEKLKSTIINIKVNQQGITLTDNNRKYMPYCFALLLFIFIFICIAM